MTREQMIDEAVKRAFKMGYYLVGIENIVSAVRIEYRKIASACSS